MIKFLKEFTYDFILIWVVLILCISCSCGYILFMQLIGQYPID